jgi:hypothetical protein
LMHSSTMYAGSSHSVEDATLHGDEKSSGWILQQNLHLMLQLSVGVI